MTSHSALPLLKNATGTTCESEHNHDEIHDRMFGQWSGSLIVSDSAFIVHLYKGLGGLRFDDDALYLYLHATEVNNISINANNLLRPTLRCH
jgi:hypothetical protein